MKFSDRIKVAVRDISQANIGEAVKTIFGYNGNVLSGSYRGGNHGLMGIESNGSGGFFHHMDMNYGNYHYQGGDLMQYAKAYTLCPPLASILNRSAQAYTNGVLHIHDVRGTDTGPESNKAAAKKIRSLLKKPNPLQTQSQFLSQQNIYKRLFGFCPVLIGKAVGFDNVEAEHLWNIPPFLCKIEEADGMPYSRSYNVGIKSITFCYGDYETNLPLDRVYIFKDITTSFETINIPDSRMMSLVMPVNNIIGAYESRNTLINSRGAMGILTNETKDAFSALPLKEDEKNRILSEYKTKYGLRAGQAGIIITSAALRWQNMTLATKDLMLFEEIEDDANRICEVYNFPPELMGRLGKSVLPANMQTATRNLYQDSIIPESKNDFEQWNDFFETEKYGITMHLSYNHLAVLQPDKKAEAEARLRRNQALQIEFRNDIITQNQWRIMNGLEPLDDGDVFYSEIKERFRTNYNDPNLSPTNIEDTYVEDNLDPRQNVGDASNINPED